MVPLTATPDTGYSLSAWTGACTGTGACTVTMDADKTVGATFAIQRYTLTVTLPTNGTITGHRHQLRHRRQRLHRDLRLRNRRPAHRHSRHRLQPQRLDRRLLRHRRLLGRP